MFLKNFGLRRRIKKAQKYILSGKDSEGKEILEKLNEENNENSDILLWLSIAKTNLKDFPSALAIIDQALELSPSNSICKMIKGEILIFLNRYEEAIKILCDAFETNPDNTRISYLIGLAHIKMGDIEKASSFFELALKYDRELVESRLLCMAELYLHKKG